MIYVGTVCQTCMVKKLKIGRNAKCPCGSGTKYKHCCGRPEGRDRIFSLQQLLRLREKTTRILQQTGRRLKAVLSPLVLGIVSVVWIFVQFLGLPFYEATIPEIHPNSQASDPSSYQLPFSITNHSPYLVMQNIKLHCDYSIVVWDLQKEKTLDRLFRAKGSILTSSKQEDVSINTRDAVNFPCDASEAAKATIEGRLLPIVEIRVRIKMDYQTNVGFASIPRFYTSPLFIWKSTSSGFQWFEGDIIE